MLVYEEEVRGPVTAALKELKGLYEGLPEGRVDLAHSVAHTVDVVRHTLRSLQSPHPTALSPPQAPATETAEGIFVVPQKDGSAHPDGSGGPTCGEQLGAGERLSVVLAAALHEADDHKLFGRTGEGAEGELPKPPEGVIEADARDYPNALRILEELDVGGDKGVVVASTMRMISLVSCSKNKNALPEGVLEWMLIPRMADRLEAIGAVGILRCYDYNTHKKSPISVDSTPRPGTEAELWQHATPKRFAAYTGGSDSMVDHYYDKLLPVSVTFHSGNHYLDGEAADRRSLTVKFCLDFARDGALPDMEALRTACSACREGPPTYTL